jgi:hypothetical protein
MHKVEHDLTEAQVQYISIATAIVMVPAAIYMLYHARSMMKRYGGNPVSVPSGKKGQ